MTSSFDACFADRLHNFNTRLAQLLDRESPGDYPEDPSLSRLHEAIAYAVRNGGKRVRPLLVYAAAHAVNHKDSEPALDYAACALEMIHSYSLVHDDLPAMDDDDLRRGMPSCHKAYDEATAMLVGDALHSRAFELISEAPGLSAQQKIDMVQVLAAAAGSRGMVGGQAVDVSATGSNMSLTRLQAMHSMKTGALIQASLTLGGIVAGAGTNELTALESYGKDIGLAFQVVDDILDVEGDTSTLGKTRGKDLEADKPTYVKLLGLEPARAEARRLLDSALQSLAPFGQAASQLKAIAQFIIERDR